MTGRVIHTGQAVVDFVLNVGRLPEPGGDVFAESRGLTAGGGFNVMAAAARDGAAVAYAGAHGTGPFGDIVRAAMAAEHIEVLSPPVRGQDTGVSIALVDADAERTFVSTLGAEGTASTADYRATRPNRDDVVYATGYSLLHPQTRVALGEWLPELPREVRVVVDPSPVIGEVDINTLRLAVERADVWSTNEREAHIVARRWGHPIAEGAMPEEAARQLAVVLGCSVVLRAGARGAAFAVLEANTGLITRSSMLAGMSVHAVDTNGAGDAHCGVMCAALARGLGLEAATRRANVAAAIAVTRHGPATAPSAAETDAVLFQQRSLGS